MTQATTKTLAATLLPVLPDNLEAGRRILKGMLRSLAIPLLAFAMFLVV